MFNCYNDFQYSNCQQQSMIDMCPAVPFHAFYQHKLFDILTIEYLIDECLIIDQQIIDQQIFPV